MAKANSLLQLVYDGLSDPKIFEQNFNIHKECNEWSDARQLVILPVLLKDKAKRLYDSFSKVVDPTATTVVNKTGAALLKELVSACEQQKECMLYQFYERQRLPGESVSKFAQVIQELLLKALPNLSPENMSSLLRAQLCLHVPQDLRALIQFSSTFGTASWDKLLASLDKSCPTSLIKSDASARWDSYSVSREPLPLIKEEPLEMNYAGATFRPDIRNQPNTRQQNSSNQGFRQRFDGTCDYCHFYGHKMADCRKRARLTNQTPRNFRALPRQSNYAASNSQTRYDGSSNRFGGRTPSGPLVTEQFNTQLLEDQQSYGMQTQYNAIPHDDYSDVNENENPINIDGEEEYPFFMAENHATDVEVDVLTVSLLNIAKLPRVNVRINVLNETKQVEALLDSASSTTFYSPEILSPEQIARIKANENCFRRNIKVNGAVASTLAKACITNAEFKIGEWCGSMPVVITSAVSNFPVVLGKDFFEKYGVILDFSKNTITIGSYDMAINLIVSSEIVQPKSSNLVIDPLESIDLLQMKAQLDELSGKLSKYQLELKPMNCNATQLLEKSTVSSVTASNYLTELSPIDNNMVQQQIC